jgi:hypothetical protein
MALSPSRLRILSGKHFQGPAGLASRNHNDFFFWQTTSLHDSIVPIHPIYRNNDELGTKKLLHSWRQRRFRLLVLAATSNKRLRCDFGMEGKLSGGGTIRYIIQVRECDSAIK